MENREVDSESQTNASTQIMAEGTFSRTGTRNVCVVGLAYGTYLVAYTNAQDNFSSRAALAVQSGSRLEFLSETELFGQFSVSSMKAIALNPKMVVLMGKIAFANAQHAVMTLIRVHHESRTIEVDHTIDPVALFQIIPKGFDKFAIARVSANRLGVAHYTNETRSLYVTVGEMGPGGFMASRPERVYTGLVDQFDVCGFGERDDASAGLVLAYNQDVASESGVSFAGHAITLLLDRYEVRGGSVSPPIKLADYMGSVSVTRMTNNMVDFVFEQEDGTVASMTASAEGGKLAMTASTSTVAKGEFFGLTASAIGQSGLLLLTLDGSRKSADVYAGERQSGGKIHLDKMATATSRSINSFSLDYPKMPKINECAIALGSAESGTVYLIDLPEPFRP